MRRNNEIGSRFQRLVHGAATYGEDPSLVGTRDQAWNDHLDQYLHGYGTASWIVELLRGAAGHVWWRLTASTQRSSLSTGLAALTAGLASLGLMAAGYEDFVSAAAEAHSALGLLAVGSALAWNPWTLSRRRISTASLVASSGLAHLALSSTIFVWFDYVLQLGLLTAAAGLLYISMSSLRTQNPLGASRFGVWSVFVGAMLVACAQFLWALEPTDSAYAASSAVASFASAAAGLRILDLWAMQEPPHPTALRLLGSGRRRQRSGLNIRPRSPLATRAAGF